MRHLTVTAILAALIAAAPSYADKDKGSPAANQGQVVSECNHRANQRNLKGQERKDYVEWCQSRGLRYGYDERRYDSDRDCYRKAYDKGLTGDRRAAFLNKCLDGGDSDLKRETDGVGENGKPRGRDVPGNGDKK